MTQRLKAVEAKTKADQATEKKRNQAATERASQETQDEIKAILVAAEAASKASWNVAELTPKKR